MPDSRIRARFAALVKKLGGTVGAADIFKCSPSMVSLISSSNRDPGLKLATRIQRAGVGVGIVIKADDWT